MIPFGAAHTYMANIWEYPPPGGVSVFNAVPRLHWREGGRGGEGVDSRDMFEDLSSHLWIKQIRGHFFTQEESACLRPRPHVSGWIWKRKLFSLRIGLPSTRIRWIRMPKTQTFENALRSGNFWKRKPSGYVWTGKTELFENADVTAAVPNMAPDRRETKRNIWG